MGDTFLKTLHSVVSGARKMEDFCHVLVGAAVEDVLLCVSRDYGHDYGELLRKYRTEVVRRHAGGASVQKTQCRGTAKNGKRCVKRGVLHGYCEQHAVEMAEEEAKGRKAKAYAAALPTSNATTETAKLLAGAVPRGVTLRHVVDGLSMVL